MKKIIFSCLFPLAAFAQGNLVPNGSFENCNVIPPIGLSEFGETPPYTDVYGWYNPNTCSPDYYNMTYLPDYSNYITIPDGLGFVGFATYMMNEIGEPQFINAREYVSCTLIDTLQANAYYWVQFYAQLASNMSLCASNNLGVHFSDTAMHADDWYYFDVDAQVKYFNNEIIEDTVNWTLVSGVYQAHGGEQFLTLGNFNSDAETDRGILLTQGPAQTYFYVDDVVVIPLDSIAEGINFDAGPDQTIYIEDTTFIGQRISNMPANWFKLDGTPVAQNTAGVYVSPLETTTYVVTQTLNGVYSTDTVTVFVEGLGIEEKQFGEWSIAPNPNKGNFSVQLKTALTETLELRITDSQGRKVWQETFPAFSKVCNLQTNLSAGVYFLQLSSNGQKSELKRVVVE